MKKQIAFFLVLLLAVSFAGCAENVVLEDTYVYTVESDVHSLEIQIGAADFTIQHADAFSVESNLKYLSISEVDGVLSVIDEKTKGVTYDGSILTIYMPADTVFEIINITTGAAKLTADSLSAKSLKLQLGAGDVSIANLSAQTNADIKGGAGKITIAGGTMNNLELKMGVGELNLTAALLGNNNLTFGVGGSNITLIGSRDDYKISVEKGIGSITVAGKTVADFGSSGNGQNRVRIEGGVGTVDLEFLEPESK